MKFAEIAESIGPIDYQNLDEASAALDQLLTADDLDEDDRGAFCAGQLAGMSLMFAAYQQRGEEFAGQQLVARLTDFEMRGWL